MAGVRGCSLWGLSVAARAEAPGWLLKQAEASLILKPGLLLVIQVSLSIF